MRTARRPIAGFSWSYNLLRRSSFAIYYWCPNDIGTGRWIDLKIFDFCAEMPAKEENRIFVGGLSWDTTERRLEGEFSRFGKVIEAQVMLERDTGRPRGFGFVTFSDPRAVDTSISEMHGHELDGRVISVNKAQPKMSTDDTAYGYNGGGYTSGSRAGYRGDDGPPPTGCSMNASSVVVLDIGHVSALRPGEAVMVVSLLVLSLAGVVAVGTMVGGQIATVIAIQMISMMGAVIDMLMIVTDLPGIVFWVIGMEVDLIITCRMDTAGKEAMNEMVRMVVVPMIEREGQEAVAMTGMDHAVVAVTDMGAVAVHVMMVVEVTGTGPGHMIDQVGVGTHHLLMFAIDECRLLTVKLQ
ncbi:unnamed protein product, partial [Musa textilis]